MILAIQRQPGTNTVDVVDNIKQLLPEFRHELPPAISLETAADTSDSIRNSIHDVEFTLLLTICVVVMVIFLFLRNVSATLIPGAAVPFSILGTFAVMYLLGYSLNNLSLMALTLSVGFVVDDAIVMLENIVRHMEMGKTRMEAALAGLAGDRLHHHLDDAVAGGRLHSGAVHGGDCGTPVARVFGHYRGGHPDLRICVADADTHAGQPLPEIGARGAPRPRLPLLEGGFNALAHWYESSLRIAMRFRLVTLAVAVLMLVGTVYLFKTMPTGFIPSQDSGFMFGVIMGPPRTSRLKAWRGTYTRWEEVVAGQSERLQYRCHGRRVWRAEQHRHSSSA